MTIKVRYLSEAEIEKDAELLLAEYEETAGAPIKLPVPVDAITTYHLALRLGFANLHDTLGVPQLREQPDILGAIWIGSETILIDNSLDPQRNPALKGRYSFSVAHEIGHWRLHRSYLANDCGQSEPTFICRTSQAKERIEWQADCYASRLLMPRKLVMQAWQTAFKSHRPFVFTWERSPFFNPGLTIDGKEVNQGNVNIMADFDFDVVAQPFARRFGVSVQAMRIRLQKLGLLQVSSSQRSPSAGG